MITEKGIKRAMGAFSMLRYFPADEDARAAFMEILGAMCSSDEQVIWLAKRTLQLHREWPGPLEVRAILCSKFLPRDGIEADSTLYVEGIPSERETHTVLTAGTPILALPAGVEASMDPEMEKLAGEVAEACKMPPMPKYRARSEDEKRVHAELRRICGMGTGEAEA